ncbi:GMC family oxidoreductase [Arthrobacter agilis]|uniref:GMC family oxidoreductase n=1 Tax=Arthrobacter agilis TaxID=37921 RepID=UPI00278259CB|nr:GMC family oxidoreductase N-terminal domain-containing protein [Arthrobacter agilis]MDQ0734736.1 choline dehydrogenase [Arthrobacter agilis]
MTHASASAQDSARDSVDVVDVVVVGAGSAGAALAARLTEDPTRRVVLLEAGGPDKDISIRVPAAFSKLFKTSADWNYETVPQANLHGRTVYWPRGKVLGGSSSLNAMMWVRGFAADYDTWGELLGPEWSWPAMRTLLARIERPAGAPEGAVSVEAQRSPSALTDAFLRAVEQAGLSVEAANAEQPEGFTQTMVTQHRGSRSSTAAAYLEPARRRPNLDIRTGAHATRVLFDGIRATGVEYLQDGELRQVHARAEVVLCGGSVNTPQLLELSGIGQAARLRALGIDVLVDRPEVGENLQDHLVSALIPEVRGGTLLDATKPAQLVNYLTRRRGMLTSNVAEAYGFVRSRPELPLPDIEMLFAPVAYVGEGLLPVPAHGITLGPILLTPQSRGSVHIRSADPFDKPAIDPRYLSDPEGADRAAIMAGFRVVERLLATPALKQHLTGRFLAPEGGDTMTPEERSTEALHRYGHTLYHPTGTARMGRDDDAVVDPSLRVRGVHNLRVADASVMPQIIRGHTNAPSIAIGERAADLIRQARSSLHA